MKGNYVKVKSYFVDVSDGLVSGWYQWLPRTKYAIVSKIILLLWKLHFNTTVGILYIPGSITGVAIHWKYLWAFAMSSVYYTGGYTGYNVCAKMICCDLLDIIADRKNIDELHTELKKTY